MEYVETTRGPNEMGEFRGSDPMGACSVEIPLQVNAERGRSIWARRCVRSTILRFLDSVASGSVSRSSWQTLAFSSQNGNQSDARLSLGKPLPGAIGEACRELRNLAEQFVDKGCDATPSQGAATFCRECGDSSGIHIIERLLAREGRVLKQRGNDVVPGLAFRGTAVDEADTTRGDEEVEDETQGTQITPLPPEISYRVRNLYWFSFDLRGELEDKLFPAFEPFRSEGRVRLRKRLGC
jgi:hypothetical protein